MKIKIKDIGPNGLDIDEHLDPAELDLKSQEFQCVSTIDIVAKVERLGDTVMANTEAKAKFAFFCGRCLEPVEREVKENFFLDYKIDRTTQAIELNEDIRQEIILGFPTIVWCKEDCKGLCPGCGVNLNIEQCKCHKTQDK